jgi:hypothetical protein
MLKYLGWLHEASNDEKWALVMDSFGAQFPLEVTGLARRLEISSFRCRKDWLVNGNRWIAGALAHQADRPAPAEREVGGQSWDGVEPHRGSQAT